MEPAAQPASIDPVAQVGMAIGGNAAKRPGGGQRFLLSALIAVLGLATVANGAFLVQSGDDVKTTDSAVAALETENSTLQASIAQQQMAADGLLSQIAAMQQTVSSLSGTTPTGAPTPTDFTVPAKIIEPTIVYVEATDRFGAGTGSGTIIRADGYVLTNQHVIAGSTAISITLKTGEKFTATVLASNADLDAAVLKLNTTRKDFPVATMGNSATVAVGQEILTCGFPLGSELFGSANFGPATFNHGMVSAIRNLASGNTENPAVKLDYIQIDADINPGNSGGGLFTLDGKLVGIPSYGFSTGINTAIPINAVQALIQSAYAK
jgi:serine protease Do